MKKEYRSYKEDTRMFDSIKENKVKCKCGHVQVITNRVGKAICKWCGNYIYKDEKNKFKSEMMKRIKVIKNEKESR